mmetsp:Transcript_16386/g.25328  ORF Transcript_16386/g.25328 Transcript_16386/m.25328 type:complete len:83 (-) Transcript_16386:731-979(-)
MEAVIVMNYGGDNLPTFLKKRKAPLTQEEAVIILQGILRAVHYLHSAKLIHRQLDPSHILIDTDLHVRICGFGQARFYHKPL